MKTSQPPSLAVKFVKFFAPGPQGDTLTSELMEQFRVEHSTVHFWRRALVGVPGCVARDSTLGFWAVALAVGVLSLILVSVRRHPASLGSEFLLTDLALLSCYLAFTVWGWRQQSLQVRAGLTVGAKAGLVLGLVLMSSHAIEWSGLDVGKLAQFARGAGMILVMLSVLAGTGSAGWERTRSVRLGVVAGLWCGSLAILLMLSLAFALNLCFERRSIQWLHQAFVTSGMDEPGAFVVRNALQSSSEILMMVPVLGLVLSFIGSAMSALILTRSSRVSLSSAWIVPLPLVFAGGVASLWYADSLQRAARPPFILGGVLAAGLAACSAHPIWSSVFRRQEAVKQ